MKFLKKSIAILILTVLLIAAKPAQDAPNTVTNANDSGPGSLRQAIADAGISAGSTITFDGDYTITLASTLTIDKYLTIDGTGHNITISGNNTIQVMSISYGVTVSLNNLIITNGNRLYNNSGGGIFNSGTLTINNCTFSSNTASYIGGGIYNGHVLTINNSTFSGNVAATYGGGIYNGNMLTVNNSTFSGNVANDGGGMYNDGALMTVNNSTFSGNTAYYAGGGIYNDSIITVNNSTFSSNAAITYGGGIYNASLSELKLKNSILANSVAGIEDCDNFPTGIVTNTNNLIETDAVGQHQCVSPGTPMLSADPQLGGLANNGGDTQTFALLSGSPAIDAGENTSCETTDQRGVTRPQGATCDIGAYEAGAVILTVTDTSPSTGATLSSATTIEITFNEDPVTGSTNAKAVDNPGNYLLVERGDAIFDTQSCAGGVQADDVLQTVSLSSINYNPATLTATLTLASSLTTPGHYRLFICGTTSIWSAAGLELNNGLSDTTVDFTVQATASALPDTGFRHGQVTSVPEQPAVKAYTETTMMLEIPKIGVSMPIVGVPQTENAWDVNWLGNSAGYLAGSAFPTWAGNTVITGHVWDAYNNPGIFSDLKMLKYGDQVQIHAWGQIYTYEVRESNLVTSKNVNVVLQSEELDWLTLVTCEFYNPFTGEYLFRRAVRAVLVSVK